jgi:tRNA dimethylallyltransferase
LHTIIKRSLIIILGPTAAGKSALGVKLAKQFSGVVISADSRQVYRGLDLGTGKITHSEMNGVPHYLLNVAAPRGRYSVARYYQNVRRVLKSVPIHKPIFLVGGSPFYIKAVTEPGSFSVIPPDIKLRRRLAALDTASLMARLQRIDPTRSKIIDPANRRRLIRAIEIASAPLAKGGHIKGVQIPPGGISNPALFDRIIKIGLTLPRSELYRRIDLRVDRRVHQGMIQEVARLHRQGLSWKKMDSFGLEYRFLSRFLRKQISRQEAVVGLKGATHDFARRQMTWWKRESDIRWIKNYTAAKKLVDEFLA